MRSAARRAAAAARACPWRRRSRTLRAAAPRR